MARRSSVMVSRSLYQIGIVTLMGAITWVGLGVYLAIGKEGAVTEVDKSILEPINPTLDQKTMEALVGRAKVEVDLSTINVISVDEVASPGASIVVDGVR